MRYRPWPTLVTMCAALFLTMLDTTVVSLGLPRIQADLGGGVSGLQWVFDGYTLPFAALLLPWGTAADRYGRRRVFVIGLALFTLGSVACALAPALPMLVAGRVAQGAGAAALTPASLATITAAFPDPRERATAIGVWSGVSGIALTAGPLVGGWLVQAYGWPWMFWINVPVGALALVATALVVPESRDPRPGRLDPAGLVLGVTWMAALTYAVIEGPDAGWTTPRILASFAVAAAGFTAFLLVERGHPRPMVPLRLFADRTIGGASAAVFAVAFGVFAMMFFLSLFLQQVQGYSALAAGIRAMPATISTAVTATAAGALASRIAPRALITTGLLLCALGLAGFVTVNSGTSFAAYWWLELPIGMGLGLTFTPTNAAIMAAVPSAQAGVASAITNAARQLGTVLGIAVIGAVVTTREAALLRTHQPPHAAFTGGMHAGLLVAAAVALLGALAAAAIRAPGQTSSPLSRSVESTMR